MPPRRRGVQEKSVAGIQGPSSALTAFLREQGIHDEEVRRRNNRMGRYQPDGDDDQRDGSDPGGAENEDQPPDMDNSSTTAYQFQTEQDHSSPQASESDDDKDIDDIDAEDVGAKTNACTRCGRPSNNRICLVCRRAELSTSNIEHLRTDPETHSRKRLRMVDATKALQTPQSLQHASALSLSSAVNSNEFAEKSTSSVAGVVPDKAINLTTRILSKNRELTDQALHALLGPSIRTLELTDCSKLNADDFKYIVNFCPYLESLTLDYCGRLTNEAMMSFTKLTHLHSLSLHGAYSVYREVWINYFSALPRPLYLFALRQTNRFFTDCLEALVRSSPSLAVLRLVEIQSFQNDSLSAIIPLESLKSLDVIRAGIQYGSTISDSAFRQVFTSGFPSLEHLDLEGNSLVSLETVQVIHDALASLSSLILNDCVEIENAYLIDLFTNWKNPPLSCIGLARISLLEDSGLKSIIDHSGSHLTHLNIHSCEGLTKDSIQYLARRCKKIEVLNVSFVRSIDDSLLNEIISSLPRLRAIFVWGLNLSSMLRPRPGVAVYGREYSKQFELDRHLVQWT